MPPTPERVRLGRWLFFDKRLSKSQALSCASCHDLAHFGVDGLPTSSGHKGQLGRRNSQSVYNRMKTDREREAGQHGQLVDGVLDLGGALGVDRRHVMVGDEHDARDVPHAHAQPLQQAVEQGV